MASAHAALYCLNVAARGDPYTTYTGRSTYDRIIPNTWGAEWSGSQGPRGRVKEVRGEPERTSWGIIAQTPHVWNLMSIH